MSALNLFKRNGVYTIIQVGDFGFWPGKVGQAFLNDVTKILTANGQYMIVVPGNHEDYRHINSLQKDADGWLDAKPRLRVAPRGHRWTHEGVSFVALGGAPSVDRAWRVQAQRRSGFPVWWPEEEVTQEDVDVTVAGGYADVMIAHDAPWGVPTIEKRIKDNPQGFEDEDLEYALVGRTRMLEAVIGVSPKLYVHGHYHFPVNDKITTPTGEEVRIFGLSADMTYGTCAILDLSTMQITTVG